MKLHSKLHLTFIPLFYSIACLSKLRNIITSLHRALSGLLGKFFSLSSTWWHKSKTFGLKEELYMLHKILGVPF